MVGKKKTDVALGACLAALFACGGKEKASTGEGPDVGGAVLRVSLTDQAPVADCTARILGTVWRAACDENGTLRFSGVWTGDRDIEIMTAEEGLEDLAPSVVTVGFNPGQITDLDVTLYRSGGAHGKVSDTEPRLIDALVASGSSFALSATSGVYLLRGLVPGRRRLSAFLDDGVITLSDVPIEEGDVSVPVDFAFANWETGDGRVDGVVEAYGATTVDVRALNTRTGEPVFSEEAQENGGQKSFAFEALPGAYWVEARAEIPVDGETMRLRVSRLVFVAPRETSTLRLALPSPDLLDKDKLGDLDGDGIPDEADLDPFDPRREASRDSDGDGIPDNFDTGGLPPTSDTDGDGWANGFDNCPDDANPTQDPLACNECLMDTDCDGGEHCDTGDLTCYECVIDAHCGDGNTCVNHECQEGGDGAAGITAVGVGKSHTCALKDGEVYCFGGNGFGELGVGAATPGGPTPRKVAGLGTVTDLAVGAEHTCTVNNLGEVHCWGRNSVGEVGALPDGVVYLPSKVNGLPADNVAVSAGESHSCAVSASGVVHCWGIDSNGQLGDGLSNSSGFQPVLVSVTGALKISSGGNMNCVEVVGGTTKCWGDNNAGPLGNGAGLPGQPVHTPESTANPLPSFGNAHACALDSADTAACWGWDDDLQLGDDVEGFPVSSSSAQEVNHLPPGTVTRIAAMGNHSCGVESAVLLSCWGDNTHHQLGGEIPPDKLFVEHSLNQASLTLPKGGSGAEHTCVIGDTAIFCWGKNGDGQCGSHSAGDDVESPVQVMEF